MNLLQTEWLRTVLTVALWIIGYPVLWPSYVLWNSMQQRRHKALVDRIVSSERGAALQRIEHGQATGGFESVLVMVDMASGLEESVVFEITFRGSGSVALAWSGELSALLVAEGIPLRRIEVRDTSLLQIVIGWPLWAASVLLLISYFMSDVL